MDLLANTIHDAVHGLRLLRRNPGFAIGAIATLALGIGANTAIFTIVSAVLLKPLSFHDPDRLVLISGGATIGRFQELQTTPSLSGTAAYVGNVENFALSGVDVAEPLKGARVSVNFLSVLGVVPQSGRAFIAEDETPGRQTALISASLWRRRFGANPQIIGATARIGAEPCTIVGVLPEGFAFPFPDLDVWRPLQPATMRTPSRINSPVLTVFARLNSGTSLERVTSEVAVVDRRYAIANPGKLDAKPNRPERVVPLKDQLVRNVRPVLWMLFGAVGLLLLIACANVSGLLLARATARTRELSIRAALGASRSRIASQLFTETLLLSLAGTVFGVLLAESILKTLIAMPGLELPRAGEIQLDDTVLGFALLLSLVAGLLSGLLPSLTASRVDLIGAVKGLEHRRRSRGVLVAGQIALSIVLLIGAALLIESLGRLRQVDPGFQPANLLTMQITLPQSRFDEFVERVQSLPGVRSAAITLTLPMTGFAGMPVQPADVPVAKLNERPIAVVQLTSPGYLQTMGIALRRGRDFSRADTAQSTPVAIVNESLARRFWPAYPGGEDPIGKFLIAGVSTQPLRIVGIAADVHQAGLAEAAAPGIFRPRAQSPPASAMFVVRTNGNPLLFTNAIRAQLIAIDPDQTITAVKTMEQVVEASEGQRRSVMILLGLFAGTGLLMVIIGTYGLIAHNVAQRARELSIRRALGAQNTDILRLILRQALILSVAGSVLGLAGAYVATRLLRSLLFEVSPTEPAIFVSIPIALSMIALLAGYLPARRANQIDPAVTLRSN